MLKNIPVLQLHRGQYQPREDFDLDSLQELANSIQSQGLIEPLVVRQLSHYSYEIIAGERRWRAAKMVGMTDVPCVIGQYSDEQACAVTLIENIQREDLNVIEEAMGYKRLLDEFHFNQEDIAILVGKSRSHIANILRLLTLEEGVKIALKEKQLTLGHARMLVVLPASMQQYFLKTCLDEAWSVRQLEQAVKAHKSKPIGFENMKKDRDVERLQIQLAEQVGAPVEIVNDKDAGGWLKLKFFDNDTLAGLLERLGLRYD